jgi:hypothetical protein
MIRLHSPSDSAGALNDASYRGCFEDAGVAEEHTRASNGIKVFRLTIQLRFAQVVGLWKLRTLTIMLDKNRKTVEFRLS